MNDEPTNAARLAEWLEGGGDPPDDLDPDVLAVVYTIQPDRAPKARVSLDDILGSVTEGPFAIQAPTAAPAPEFPEGREARPGLRVHDGQGERPAAAKPAKRKGVSPFWMAPAFGVVLAAAAAAVLVFPMASKLKGLNAPAVLPEEEVAYRLPMEDARPPAAAPALPEMEGGAAEQPSMAATPPPMGGAPADAPTGVPGAAAEKKDELTKAPATNIQGDGAFATGSGGAAQSAGPSMDAVPAADATTARPAPPATTAATTTTTAATTVPAEPMREERAAETEALGYSSGRVIAEADQADEESLSAASKTKKEAGESRRSAPSKSASAQAPAAAPAARSADLDDTTSARDQATPLDYNPGWYTSDATVAALYAGPLALEANGDRAGAAAAWQVLVTNARTDVGQDAALRAAKDLRALGQNSDALRVVDQGLRRSSANTPFRAALYALRGDLFNAVGNNPQAEAAWKEAARLNMSR